MGNRIYVLTSLILASTIAKAETVYIKASAARLRSEISLDVDSTIVGRFAQNTPVEVLERKKVDGKGSWIRVKRGNKEGWINERITSPRKVVAAAAPGKSAPVAKAATAPATAPAKPTAARVAAPTPPPRPATTSVARTTPEPKAPVAKTEPKRKEDKPSEAQPVARTRGLGKPEAPIKKEDIPVVEKSAAAAGPEKCINSLSTMTPEQAAVLKPVLKSGELHNNWRSPRGTSFSINESGPIKLTLHSLPAQAKQELVRGSGYDASVIDLLLANGGLAFRGEICRKGETFVINLDGDGVTAGKRGRLALRPDKGGFTADGVLAGTKLTEHFGAAEGAR